MNNYTNPKICSLPKAAELRASLAAEYRSGTIRRFNSRLCDINLYFPAFDPKARRRILDFRNFFRFAFRKYIQLSHEHKKRDFKRINEILRAIQSFLLFQAVKITDKIG